MSAESFERELCAQIATGQKKGYGDLRDDDRTRYYNAACEDIAAAIRNNKGLNKMTTEAFETSTNSIANLTIGDVLAMLEAVGATNTSLVAKDKDGVAIYTVAVAIGEEAIILDQAASMIAEGTLEL